jgi:hypothetical protein
MVLRSWPCWAPQHKKDLDLSFSGGENSLNCICRHRRRNEEFRHLKTRCYIFRMCDYRWSFAYAEAAAVVFWAALAVAAFFS